MHFDGALVQLELDSVLDVHSDMDLDMNLSVNSEMEIERELFDFISV